eukprot:tig00000053_g23494.t1
MQLPRSRAVELGSPREPTTPLPPAGYRKRKKPLTPDFTCFPAPGRRNDRASVVVTDVSWFRSGPRRRRGTELIDAWRDRLSPILSSLRDKAHNCSNFHKLYSSNMAFSVSYRASTIEYNNLRFILMDAPTDANLPVYIKELNKANVKHVVRVCDATYSSEPLERMDIKLHHWPWPDGASPPENILNDWLKLCGDTFSKEVDPPETIAVHCVAGLGRAPVLIAVALIEKGMDPLDAVEYVRQRRRGAFNANQLKWLYAYKRRGAFKGKKGKGGIAAFMSNLFGGKGGGSSSKKAGGSDRREVGVHDAAQPTVAVNS